MRQGARYGDVAKVIGPLYSASAQGTIGGSLTYQRRGHSFVAQRPPRSKPTPTPKRQETRAYFSWALAIAQACVKHGVGFEEGPPELRRPWEDAWYEHWSLSVLGFQRFSASAVKRALPGPRPPFGPGSRGFATSLVPRRTTDWRSWLMAQLLNRATRTSGNRFVDFMELQPEYEDAWINACPEVLVAAFSRRPPGKRSGDAVAFNTFFACRQVAAVFLAGSALPLPSRVFPLHAYGRTRARRVPRFQVASDRLSSNPYRRHVPVVPRG